MPGLEKRVVILIGRHFQRKRWIIKSHRLYVGFLRLLFGLPTGSLFGTWICHKLMSAMGVSYDGLIIVIFVTMAPSSHSGAGTKRQKDPSTSQ